MGADIYFENNVCDNNEQMLDCKPSINDAEIVDI